MFDTEAQKPVRALLSSAFETEMDKQGRILLPQELRNYAGITKNVVSIGVGSRVEIWSEEKFDEYNTDDFDEASNALTKYGV